MSSIDDKSHRLARLFSTVKSALGRPKKATGSQQRRSVQAQVHMGKGSFEAGHDTYMTPKPLLAAGERAEGGMGRPSVHDHFGTEHGENVTALDCKAPKANEDLVPQNALGTSSFAGHRNPSRRRAVSGASLRPSRSERSMSSTSLPVASFDASLLETDSPLTRLAQQTKAQGRTLARIRPPPAHSE